MAVITAGCRDVRLSAVVLNGTRSPFCGRNTFLFLFGGPTSLTQQHLQQHLRESGHIFYILVGDCGVIIGVCSCEGAHTGYSRFCPNKWTDVYEIPMISPRLTSKFMLQSCDRLKLGTFRIFAFTILLLIGIFLFPSMENMQLRPTTWSMLKEGSWTWMTC